MAKDLVISLGDRPGGLADICQAAGRAGVNLDGGCAFPYNGREVFHVLVEDVEGFRGAVQSAGFDIQEERDVLVFDMDDRPGALGDVLRRISNAGVNVDLLYLATRTRVVIGTDNPDRARVALL